MGEFKEERWRRIAEEAASERDSDKLLKLIEELTRELEKRGIPPEKARQNPELQPSDPNRQVAEKTEKAGPS